MSLDLQLSGKTAIVTGGSTGIVKRDRSAESRKTRASSQHYPITRTPTSLKSPASEEV